jgi:hypothetical protein
VWCRRTAARFHCRIFVHKFLKRHRL